MKHQIELFMDNRRYTIIQNEASHSEHWEHDNPKISHSTMLPNVLLADNNNSISMVRALMQIKELLHHAAFMEKEQEGCLQASLDDISLMLSSIK